MASTVNQDLTAFGVARVVVYLRTPSALGAAADVVAINSLASNFVLTAESPDVQLQQAQVGGAAAVVAPPAPTMRIFPNLGIAYGVVNRSGLAALRLRKDLVSQVTGVPVLSPIRPIERDSAQLAVSDVNWGIDALGMRVLWAAGHRGQGVLVGHPDTGVDASHPALKGAIAHFAAFDDFGEQLPAGPGRDSATHGTHTAGTIVGRTISGREIGIAPEATLASAMVIEGGDVVARVLGGLDWMVGLKARIISMSLGLRGIHSEFRPLTNRLRALNVLPIFAVGNEGPGTSRSPGNYAEPLSVGAIEENLQVASFSSSQRFIRATNPIVPDLVGPGVDILSSLPNGLYGLKMGSSMATPQIAGLAAVLMSAKPNARARDLEKAILASCKLAPGMVGDRAGKGLPNASVALAKLNQLVP